MIGYSYDANGNQLSTPDGGWLEYDADNRMTRWNKPSTGATEQYQYHPAGWRVWKATSAGAIHYLYGPGGQLLSEGTSTHYVYFGGRLLYTMSGSSRTVVYHDRLGSTRYTDTAGARNYYPFGEEITATASDTYKFADTYRDSTSGLDYALNRYYSSNTGRFLTTDPYDRSMNPANPQSLNRYVYVQNDPTNFADPSGLLMNLVPSGYGWADEWWWRNALGIGRTGAPGTGETGRPVREGREPKVQARWQRFLIDSVDALPQPCVDALQEKLGSDILDRLKSGALNVSIYDARSGMDGSTPISSIVQGSDSTRTLAEAAEGVNAFTPRDPQTLMPLSIIVLAPTFFDLPLVNRQTTMVHEALHAIARQGDLDLAKMFTSYSGTNLGQASIEFQKWLNAGCPKKEP